MSENHGDTAGFGENSRQSQVRIAAYIADLVAEMEDLARRENIEGLARLLSEARREARRLAP